MSVSTESHINLLGSKSADAPETSAPAELKHNLFLYFPCLNVTQFLLYTRGLMISTQLHFVNMHRTQGDSGTTQMADEFKAKYI